jgi:hypothetical protein
MPIARHDLTHSPVGLWQFDGNLTDSSGQGNNLSAISGTPRYGDLFPGLRGLACDTVARIGLSSAPAVLRITGDLTVEMLIVPDKLAAALGGLVFLTGNGETQAVNTLWGVGLVNTSNAVNAPRFASESGAGVDAIYAVPHGLMPGSLNHLAVVRATSTITFYLNGKQLGAASSTLTTPDGGTSVGIYVGADATGGSTMRCSISSLKVIASALNAAQVLAEYNRTLGAFFPRLS